jgi:lipoate-protein ligase A
MMRVMAKSKQPPPVRLPKRFEVLVRERVQRIFEELRVERSPGQFVAAALVEFLKRSPREQLEAIYQSEMRLDDALKAGQIETEQLEALGVKAARPPTASRSRREADSA